MDLGTFQQPGPGFLSFSAGAVIGILAFWFLIQSTSSKGSRRETGPSEDRKGVLPKIRPWLICLALFGYILVFNGLGFVLQRFYLCFSYFLWPNLRDGGM